jgi:UDP-N-acetylglucosamine--N-acetylmuramyl-(pentapeptide) pyrophosphoryl-undecaprenol N-acetylglucosamine transferase
LYAVLRSCWLVWRLQPNVVVGTGGYVSLPTCVAAWLLRRPVVVQEQNACPGVANRALGRIATTVCLAFPQAASAFPHARCGPPREARARQRERVGRKRAERGLGRLKAKHDAHIHLTVTSKSSSSSSTTS